MQVNDLTSVDPNVDYTQILPIQQKRTIAFINHFVMNTVSFLNKFAQSCESRLMEFEYKLQKVEASLLILESQLSSIPHLDVEENNIKKEISVEQTDVEIRSEELNLPQVEEEEEVKKNEPTTDPRYEKFFKMLQFGVPLTAVQLKMQLEGFDPSILDSNAPKHQKTEDTNN